MTDYSADLHAILDNMMDVYYRTDAAGLCVLVTPSVQELLGWTVEEVMGKPIAGFYEHPEQRAETLQRLAENDGRLRGFETRLVRKDGRKVWVSSNVQFYHDAAGKVAGVEGVVRDISSHRETEENLRRSEKKFRSIIDHMLDIYYRTDAEGRLIMASPSCQTLLGYTPEELLGKRLSDLYVDPSVRELFMQKLIEQGGTYYGFENSLRRKDGTEIWAVASSQFLYDDDGKLIGVEGIVRDITRRKQMEDALRDSEQKLRTIFDNMMDTYARTDGDGVVVMVSPSVQHLLGYTPDEVVGRPLRDFYTIPDSRNTFLSLLEQNGGHYYGYEALMDRKDGSHIWVLINAQFYYDEDGSVAGVEALARNISELKQAEEQLLRAKETAEAANGAKTEFLSNMSHELRTPLNAILGFSSLLLKYSQEPLPQKAQEFVHNIHDAGRHLSDLINQVLDLAKIEAGKAQLESVPVAINRIVAECVRLLRPLAVQQRVKLYTTTDECFSGDHDVYVMGDPLRLRQVLINLISNAIKYNVDEGRITLSCSVEQGRAQVAVEDTGLGIPVAAQSEIFIPFTRAHKNINVEGSGIGLAVTRKNLELMHSAIHFTSEEGRGSRFWFEMPVIQAPPAAAAAEEEAAVVIEPLDVSVLYVEDNPMGVRLMQEVVQTIPGATFYATDSGEAGYRLALERLPDIIFMDINLPDISGFDVMKRLQDEPSTRHIPVVALTASALEEEVQRGLQAGFVRYLRKPSEPGHIIQLVADLTRGHTASGYGTA